MGAMDRSIRAGVIGVGTLGREHARIYASSERISSLVLYDQIEDRARDVAAQHGAETASSIEELLQRCDAVSICTPATHHNTAALMAFESGVDVLAEKPIAASTTEAREMVAKAKEKGSVLQVGHIERFNGAFQAAMPLLEQPLFIESHRLATFTPRGTDVSVVVDLMIHDIDLILAVLGWERIVDLRASGVGVLTGSTDIVNARLEFENGCVANITASRISREPLRKIRFFQENLYVSIDLRTKAIEAFEKTSVPDMEKLRADPSAFVRKLAIEVDRSEPLQREIHSFIEAVIHRGDPVVSGHEACEALEVAEKILKCIS